MKWQTPPPSQVAQGGALAGVIAQLGQRPGQWAVLREYKNRTSASPTASRLRTRWPGYEFVTRGDGNGGSVLYGRKLKK